MNLVVVVVSHSGGSDISSTLKKNDENTKGKYQIEDGFKKAVLQENISNYILFIRLSVCLSYRVLKDI